MGCRAARLKSCPQPLTDFRRKVISHARPIAYGRGMIRIFLLVAAMTAAPLAAPAETMTQDNVLHAEILPGWRTADGRHMAALSLTLAPGWKTYWRSPGEAGIPPMFDWQGSTNLRGVDMRWPSPVVFHLNGLQSIGYHDRLVLPFEVTLADPAASADIALTIDLGVCRDICLPAMVELRAVLPPSGEPDPAITAALNAAPVTGRRAGVSGISCQVEPIADGLRLTAAIDLPAQGGDETVVFEPADASIWVAESVTARKAGRLTAQTELVPPSGQPFALDRSGITVTVIGSGGSVEIVGCPAP